MDSPDWQGLGATTEIPKSHQPLDREIYADIVRIASWRVRNMLMLQILWGFGHAAMLGLGFRDLGFRGSSFCHGSCACAPKPFDPCSWMRKCSCHAENSCMMRFKRSGLLLQDLHVYISPVCIYICVYIYKDTICVCMCIYIYPKSKPKITNKNSRATHGPWIPPRPAGTHTST